MMCLPEFGTECRRLLASSPACSGWLLTVLERDYGRELFVTATDGTLSARITLRNFRSGARTVADRLRSFRNDPDAARALRHLKEDFSEIDSVGPRRVADFLHGRPDDDLQADARGLVRDLLQALG